MASQPPAVNPLFYKDIQLLSSTLHPDFKARPSDKAPFFAHTHAVPLTSDEFVHAQRYLPIVFSAGDNPVPLALTGLNEGVNVFVDEEGKPHAPFYIPAYVRRYPYLLARVSQDAEELSLCFDASSDLVGNIEEGERLFDGDQPTQHLNNILKFCEEFEISGQRTNQFMKRLVELDLLMDGEVAIQPPNSDKPFVYRGFQMVDEKKFAALDAETLADIHKSGVLPLIIAHLFSLALIREIFSRQMQQGKVPIPTDEPLTADA